MDLEYAAAPAAPTGVYEQIKVDVRDPKLTRTAEVFGELLEQAEAEGWTHA